MGEGKHLGSNTLILKATVPIQETHFSTIERTPHRWSHWLLICFICLISLFSLIHQTHRVTFPLVKQISIDTFQLDPKGKESSYVVRDLDKKSQKESSNTLLALSHQDLQRQHKNSIQHHDIKSEGSMRRTIAGSLHRTSSRALHRPHTSSTRRRRNQQHKTKTIPKNRGEEDQSIHRSSAVGKWRCKHKERSDLKEANPISQRNRNSKLHWSKACVTDPIAFRKNREQHRKNKRAGPRVSNTHTEKEATFIKRIRSLHRNSPDHHRIPDSNTEGRRVGRSNIGISKQDWHQHQKGEQDGINTEGGDTAGGRTSACRRRRSSKNPQRGRSSKDPQKRNPRTNLQRRRVLQRRHHRKIKITGAVEREGEHQGPRRRRPRSRIPAKHMQQKMATK